MLQIGGFAGRCSHRLRVPAEAIIARLMEKDNKKAREDARREYNDMVKVNRVIISCIDNLLSQLPSLSFNLLENEILATKNIKFSKLHCRIS